MNNKTTSAEILKLVEEHRNSLCDGVSDTLSQKAYKHYNKYNKENKDNKDNVLASLRCAASPEEQDQKKSKRHIEGTTAPDREEGSVPCAAQDSVSKNGWLQQEEVQKASVQYFKNKRTRTSTRAKEDCTRNIKVQFQIDNEYVSFIATVIKGATAIKRFSDNVDIKLQQSVITEAEELVEAIKEQHPKSVIYLGKFREVSSRGFVEGNSFKAPIEEGTLGVLWYDESDHAWNCYIHFQHVKIHGVFSKEITEKQKATNMVGEFIWYPDIKVKKKSWTERRRSNNE